MQFSTLIAELNHEEACWAAKSNRKAELHSFQPYLRNAPVHANILYVCELSALPGRIPDDANFLCTSSDSLPDAPRFSGGNAVFVRGELIEVLAEVSQVFTVEQKLYNDMHQLMEVIESEDRLQQLVEMAHGMLQNPIIIVDTSFKILAMNQAIIRERPDLEEQRKLGYMLDNNLDSMRREGVYEKTRELHYPYYSVDPNTRFGWITALVYVNGVEAAQIGVMELNHEFTRYEYELIHFLCRLVALELQKDDFYKHNQALMHSVFLSDLLEERVRDARTAQIRSKQLSWVLSDTMRLLTVFDKNYGVFDRRAQLIGEQVQKLLPGSRWVIYESKIVFLLPLPPQQQEQQLPEEAIAEYLTTNHLYAALSEPFGEILELKKYYRQCLSAFELGGQLHPKCLLYRYADYALYHIGALIAQKNRLPDFCHPAVIALSDYDKKHGSDLLATLEAYLEYVDDPTLVSAHLNIHKNTLFYRINKIKEQFALDIRSGSERARILLTMAFMKLE